LPISLKIEKRPSWKKVTRGALFYGDLSNSSYNAAIFGKKPKNLTLEIHMRTFAVSIALSVVTAAAVAVALARPPAPQMAPPEALIAKSKSDRKPDQAAFNSRLLSFDPYSVNMEYRAGIGPAAVHEREAEVFYIIDGTATMITGGKLTNETRTNPANLSGTGVEGGMTRTVSKGDFIVVPEGTPHFFSAIGGNGVLVDMSIHLPRPVPSFAELEKLVPAK
jgi:mannose-6-phosphate isomerase-like protein (cupin superfamily)